MKSQVLKSCGAVAALLLSSALHAQETVKESARCIECHRDEVQNELAGSVHLSNEVFCIECHGGDTIDTSPRARAAHSREFMGRTARRGLPRFCGQCHGPELEAFARSAHHRDTMEAELHGCLDCHAYHGTEKAERTEILKSCWECHREDKAKYDAGYGFEMKVGRLEKAVGDLEARLRALDGTVGVMRRDSEDELEEARRRLSEARAGQHSLEYESLGVSAEGGHKRAEEAYNTLNERERIFRLRWIPLAAFLLLAAAAAGLVHRKARERKA